MPEAPDLEVIQEFLTAKVVGVEIASASVVKPGVLRSLVGDFASDVPGRSVEKIARRGGLLQSRTRTNKVVLIEGLEADIGTYRTIRLTGTTGSTFTGVPSRTRNGLPVVC